MIAFSGIHQRQCWKFRDRRALAELSPSRPPPPSSGGDRRTRSNLLPMATNERALTRRRLAGCDGDRCDGSPPPLPGATATPVRGCVNFYLPTQHSPNPTVQSQGLPSTTLAAHAVAAAAFLDVVAVARDFVVAGESAAVEFKS